MQDDYLRFVMLEPAGVAALIFDPRIQMGPFANAADAPPVSDQMPPTPIRKRANTSATPQAAPHSFFGQSQGFAPGRIGCWPEPHPAMPLLENSY